MELLRKVCILMKRTGAKKMLPELPFYSLFSAQVDYVMPEDALLNLLLNTLIFYTALFVGVAVSCGPKRPNY